MTNLDALNAPQREAVISQEKRLLVLAGAGSGKTKTRLSRCLVRKPIFSGSQKSQSDINQLNEGKRPWKKLIP